MATPLETARADLALASAARDHLDTQLAPVRRQLAEDEGRLARQTDTVDRLIHEVQVLEQFAGPPGPLTWKRTGGNPAQWAGYTPAGAQVAKVRRNELTPSGYYGAWKGAWPGEPKQNASTLGQFKRAAQDAYDKANGEAGG
jgi:hypothetical protein